MSFAEIKKHRRKVARGKNIIFNVEHTVNIALISSYPINLVSSLDTLMEHKSATNSSKGMG